MTDNCVNRGTGLTLERHKETLRDPDPGFVHELLTTETPSPHTEWGEWGGLGDSDVRLRGLTQGG